ncbi:hypothetical protein ACFQH8_12940 [Halomicroarcula sp. GCM10025710]
MVLSSRARRVRSVDETERDRPKKMNRRLSRAQASTSGTNCQTMTPVRQSARSVTLSPVGWVLALEDVRSPAPADSLTTVGSGRVTDECTGTG